MTMSIHDWVILLGLLAALLFAVQRTRRHASSVSGFLAANRCAGRYLIAVAFGMAQLGVISLVWYWQQNYDVAYTSIWWGLMEGPAMIIIALSVVNFIVGTEVTPRCAWVSLGSAPDEVAYECGESRLSESGVSADVLHTLETVCIMVFTVEYVLRILTCTTAMPLGRFLRAPMNVIGSADTLGLGLGLRV